MRLMGALFALSLISGCSSWQADPEHIRPIPSERVLGFQTAVANAGEVSVVRDFGGMGAGCYIAVLVDRQLAARIGVGEETRFQVPPGTRVLGIGIDTQDDTLCGKGRLNRELAVRVEPGSQQRFRIRSDNQQGFYMTPVTQ